MFFFVSNYRKTLHGIFSVVCFGKFPVAKKFMDKWEGGESNFSFENFLSHSAEEIVGEPFSVSLILGVENCYASQGYVTKFCQKVFVSQCRNIL